MRANRGVALAAAFSVCAVVGVLAISAIGPHPIGLGTNGIVATPRIGVVLHKKKPSCVPHTFVPAGADVVNVYAGSTDHRIRPIHLELRRAGHVINSGTSAPTNQGSLDIPLRRRTTGGNDIVACALSPGIEPMVLAGGRGPHGVGFAMKYRGRAGSFDWARALARRYGEAQLAPFGSWSLLLAALLVGAAGALALWVMVADPSERRPRLPGRLARWRRIAGVPVAAWACALVALLNGAAWSLIVPVLAGGDERNHVAYVQYLAETGSPPSGRTARAFSEEERNLLKGLGIQRLVRQGVDAHPFTTRADHIRLERLAAKGGDRTAEGGQTSATNNPPGYYAVEAVVYRLTSWAGLFNRIHAMRFVSALMGALSVLLVFLFLSELLPRVPWAWSAGSLAVAFVPLFGDLSGTVKEDNLAFVACAGLLLSLVVSLRRGLTRRRGLAIGVFTAVGVLTRLAVFGLLPGVAVALALMLCRAPAGDRREAIRGAVIAAATVAIPVILYALLNTVAWDRGLLSGHPGGHTFGKHVETAAGPAHTLTGFFSYLWEFYLPALPGMDIHFPGYQLRYLWFEALVGRFGYGDHELPGPVFTLAFVVYLGVLGLAGRELFIRRVDVRARLGEIVSFLALLAGLLLLVHWVGYTTRLSANNDVTGIFETVRYLFPLLGLYGALIALAARGAGVRLGRPVGVLLVGLALALSVGAQLTSVIAFYG